MAQVMEVPTTVTPKQRSAGHPAIEAWLDSHGLTYELRNIKVSQVDRATSLRNQARIGAPLNDDQVVMYGSAMESGDEFPPIVVYQRPEKKDYVVIDGNHRVAAYDVIGQEKLNAYVVEKPSDAQITVLTFEANTRHGLPTSIEERVRQAIVLVEHGQPMTKAARMLGIPTRRVEDAVKVRRSDRRADALGVGRRWYELAATSRSTLGAIQNDNVFIAMTKLAVDTHMGVADVTNLVPKVREHMSTEQKALDYIAELRTKLSGEIKETAGNRIGLSPRVAAWNIAVRRINRTEMSEFTKAKLGSDIRKRLSLQAATAIQQLREVIEVLK